MRTGQYAQLLECAKAQDTIYDLVVMRNHAKDMYKAARRRNDNDNVQFYAAMYHAANNEIKLRNLAGRI